MAAVSMTVNGRPVRGEVEPRTLLAAYLREHLGLTGTHVGCDTSQCGACVVHLDGRAVKSCTLLALSCEGAGVLTIEGLASEGGALVRLHEAEGGTRLSYDVEAQVGGKIAQVGGRLIDGVAKKMADQFFASFVKAVGEAKVDA